MCEGEKIFFYFSFLILALFQKVVNDFFLIRDGALYGSVMIIHSHLPFVGLMYYHVLSLLKYTTARTTC